MKPDRLMLIQIVLFVVVGIACAIYVATDVVGSALLRAQNHIVVKMPESAAISKDSLVTYRGLQVGLVDEVRIEAQGVSLLISVDSTQRIPADAEAVVSMDTPLAIQHLDLRPRSDTGPYLHDGSVIGPEQTARPLPLENLLNDFTAFGDTINPQDMQRLSDALATGLNGSGPELSRILDNTEVLVRSARENLPLIQRTLDNGRAFVGPDGAEGDRLRVLSSNLRSLTDQIRSDQPQVESLLTSAPESTQRVAKLLADNDPSISALLGNLVTPAQIVAVRGPALKQTMIMVPTALNKLGTIVHGDTADFDLVFTQGPACSTPIERRSPTATEPREPGLDYHCPGDDPRLQQRGAANAPRPTTGTYDPNTGTTADGFQLGSSGGQGEQLGSRSWYSIPLQGVR